MNGSSTDQKVSLKNQIVAKSFEAKPAASNNSDYVELQKQNTNVRRQSPYEKQLSPKTVSIKSSEPVAVKVEDKTSESVIEVQAPSNTEKVETVVNNEPVKTEVKPDIINETKPA